MGTARRSKWGKNVHVIKHGKIKRGRKRCGYVQRFIQPRLGNCSSKKSLVHPVPPQSLPPSTWGPHRSEPPGVCGGSWRRRRWGPAVPGSLFAGVLSPRLQPLASARLGACPDGEGGGGRTWKEKVAQVSAASLRAGTGRGGVTPVPGRMGGFVSPGAGAPCAGCSPAAGLGTALPVHHPPSKGTRAEAPTPSLPKEAPTPPKAEAGVLGVPKEMPLPPLPTAPGTGVLCPKVGAGAPGKQHGTMSWGQPGG